MDTPNTQNNTSRVRESRKLEQKRKRQQQVRRQKIFLACSCLILTAGIGLFVTLHHNHQRAAAQEAELRKQIKQKQEAELQKQQELENNTIHFVAVGDNLIHQGIYESADTTQTVWNYDHLYEHIRDDISAADLAAVNEESIFVSDHANISSYPAFGSPVEIGDALVTAGFDIVEQANNHVFDKGITGITDTIRYWETSHPEVALLGIHDSAESAGEITTISCKDVTFSLLNYTTTVNNEPYDELPDYAVDLLRTDQVISDVKKAKEISDMTIAFLHTGAEYSTEPDTEEKTFLQLLLHQGVDIAICAHSHTLQNFETLTDDSGHQMLVYYSLGNFISTQKDPVCLLGGMADITIVRDPVSDALSIRNADLVPLVTHYNHDQNIYTVYKLSDYTDKLAASHGVHAESTEPFTLETLQEQYKKVLTQDYHTLGWHPFFTHSVTVQYPHSYLRNSYLIFPSVFQYKN